MATPHEILGVPEDASDDEINKAYRQKSKSVHPDANSSDPDAGQKFKELTDARAEAKGRGDKTKPQYSEAQRDAQRKAHWKLKGDQLKARQAAAAKRARILKIKEAQQASRKLGQKAAAKAAKAAARRAALAALKGGAGKAVGAVAARCPYVLAAAAAGIAGYAAGALAGAVELAIKDPGAAKRHRKIAAAAAAARRKSATARARAAAGL